MVDIITPADLGPDFAFDEDLEQINALATITGLGTPVAPPSVPTKVWVYGDLSEDPVALYVWDTNAEEWLAAGGGTGTPAPSGSQITPLVLGADQTHSATLTAGTYTFSDTGSPTFSTPVRDDTIPNATGGDLQGIVVWSMRVKLLSFQSLQDVMVRLKFTDFTLMIDGNVGAQVFAEDVFFLRNGDSPRSKEFSLVGHHVILVPDGGSTVGVRTQGTMTWDDDLFAGTITFYRPRVSFFGAPV